MSAFSCHCSGLTKGSITRPMPSSVAAANTAAWSAPIRRAWAVGAVSPLAGSPARSPSTFSTTPYGSTCVKPIVASRRRVPAGSAAKASRTEYSCTESSLIPSSWSRQWHLVPRFLPPGQNWHQGFSAPVHRTAAEAACPTSRPAVFWQAPVGAVTPLNGCRKRSDPTREVPAVDRAGDEVDMGAVGRPLSRRDLTELSEAVRDLDRRIEQHLARLRRERAERVWDDIPDQRLRPSG